MPYYTTIYLSDNFSVNGSILWQSVFLNEERQFLFKVHISFIPSSCTFMYVCTRGIISSFFAISQFSQFYFKYTLVLARIVQKFSDERRRINSRVKFSWDFPEGNKCLPCSRNNANWIEKSISFILHLEWRYLINSWSTTSQFSRINLHQINLNHAIFTEGYTE